MRHTVKDSGSDLMQAKSSSSGGIILSRTYLRGDCADLYLILQYDIICKLQYPMEGHNVHPVVHQSSITYERACDQSGYVVGNSAHVSITLKTPDKELRSGCFYGQIDYSIVPVDRPVFEDGESLMCLAFTIYSTTLILSPYYDEAVKNLLGESRELHLLSPSYGEGIIADKLYAGEITHLDAEVLRSTYWQERARHDIDGQVVITIVENIVGVTPAV